jgi:23S rRNA-/tRNA-specific pseudouridylate synthase
MSGVSHHEVSAEDDDIRLDRWFQRHFDGVSHGRLQKLLRTGQVRVDGKRVKGNIRLKRGQSVRVPPIPPAADQPQAPEGVSERDRRFIRDRGQQAGWARGPGRQRHPSASRRHACRAGLEGRRKTASGASAR